MGDHASSVRSEFLAGLGWSDFFNDQLTANEKELSPSRIDAIHRTRLTAIGISGQQRMELAAHDQTANYAVGDWVLGDPTTHVMHRRLDRRTLLQRSAEGRRPLQTVAANVDTLFIVTSCNEDFNVARLERYLAFANDSGADPVVVLTKADAVTNAVDFERKASDLQRALPVVAVNARSVDAAAKLSAWCGSGRTVALIGSSGVGKSTLANALVGASWSQRQATGDVRKQDSKGRHTTTSRSLHPMSAGGWVIDTPGIRSLHVGEDLEQGLEQLFAEITELAPGCKFRNCTHDHEPGCAVLAAVSAGTLDAQRLARWRKLRTETGSQGRS